MKKNPPVETFTTFSESASGKLQEAVAEIIRKFGFCTIQNFPEDEKTLVDFCSHFGSPMPRGKAMANQFSGVVGDVELRADLQESQRLPTQTSLPLEPHTAKSYTRNRPKFFAMYVVDAGFRGMEHGLNGESTLLHIDDLVQSHLSEYGNGLGLADLRLLSTTKVSLTQSYVELESALEPLLFNVGTNNSGMRLWERMMENIDLIFIDGDNHISFKAAYSRFARTVLRCPGAYCYEREKGDLIILDNRKVAHGRLGFQSSVEGIINPRKLHTIHLA